VRASEGDHHVAKTIRTTINIMTKIIAGTTIRMTMMMQEGMTETTVRTMMATELNGSEAT
jgi:hypothetical protein